MALKYRLDSEPDPALKDLYAAGDDGKWTLQVEGAVPVEKLNEFRSTNTTLLKQVDEFKSKFDGIDPEAARKALETVSKIDEKKLVDAGKLDEVIASRTKAMQEAHDKALGQATAELEGAKAQLSRLVVDQAILDAGTKLGLRQGAADDLINRGRAVFQLKDGAPAALDEKGNPRYGAKGEPLSVEEFVESLLKSAPHLFDESKGAGSSGGNGGDGGVHKGDNPFDKTKPNMTEQAKLLRTNPRLAARLAAQAGVKLPEHVTFIDRQPVRR